MLCQVSLLPFKQYCMVAICSLEGEFSCRRHFHLKTMRMIQRQSSARKRDQQRQQESERLARVVFDHC